MNKVKFTALISFFFFCSTYHHSHKLGTRHSCKMYMTYDLNPHNVYKPLPPVGPNNAAFYFWTRCSGNVVSSCSACWTTERPTGWRAARSHIAVSSKKPHIVDKILHYVPQLWVWSSSERLHPDLSEQTTLFPAVCEDDLTERGSYV
jgi:hypothetical protein